MFCIHCGNKIAGYNFNKKDIYDFKVYQEAMGEYGELEHEVEKYSEIIGEEWSDKKIEDFKKYLIDNYDKVKEIKQKDVDKYLKEIF